MNFSQSYSNESTTSLTCESVRFASGIPPIWPATDRAFFTEFSFSALRFLKAARIVALFNPLDARVSPARLVSVLLIAAERQKT